VNPHDKQFFWGGTQANEFNGVYSTIADSTSLTGFETPAMGFSNVIAPPLPPSIYKKGQVTDWNWETADALKAKPKLQTVFKNMFSYFWTGQIHETELNQQFGAVNSPFALGKHDAVAPHEYWYRALDFYTQMMSAVDVQIGQVLNNIPENLASDTVIVFSADHGDYASSHGLQGKGGSVYKECFNVPLVVYDPKGQYAKYPGVERNQLVSGVDLLRMLVTIGNEGNSDWLKEPDYYDMWGGNTRADVYSILQSQSATDGGRSYVIYSTDEFFKLSPEVQDDAPQHVIGLLANTNAAPGVQEGKLGFYHHWKLGTTEAMPAPAKQEFEYYNYGTANGKLEMTMTTPIPDNIKALLNTAIQNQLNKQLPLRYRNAQSNAIDLYWKYVQSADFPHVSTAFA
jgi:uncharacterized sulfatase